MSYSSAFALFGGGIMVAFLALAWFPISNPFAVGIYNDHGCGELYYGGTSTTTQGTQLYLVYQARQVTETYSNTTMIYSIASCISPPTSTTTQAKEDHEDSTAAIAIFSVAMIAIVALAAISRREREVRTK